MQRRRKMTMQRRIHDDDDDCDNNNVEKCRGPDWAQNEDTHFVRACAVQTHVKISSRATLCTGKMTQTKTAPQTLCEPAQSKRTSKFHKSHFTHGNLQDKCRGPDGAQNAETHTLCEPAQSKRMSRFHKSHFIQKFRGKMPQTRVSTLIKHRPLLPPSVWEQLYMFQKN